MWKLWRSARPGILFDELKKALSLSCQRYVPALPIQHPKLFNDLLAER
jgi:hypothetical protein